MVLLKMVSGDVVNWCSNGATTYVPAAGIEIVLLQVFINAQSIEYGIQDGVQWGRNYTPSGAAYLPNAEKMAITNSHSFQITTQTNVGFSGIQIK